MQLGIDWTNPKTHYKTIFKRLYFSFSRKNICVVTYSLLGVGSVEVAATGPEQALQSVHTLPLDILIAKADFKNGLEVHEIRE